MLSKEASSTIFWVFGITRPGIEPSSPCCIVICWFMQKYTYIYWINTDTMINDASRTKTPEGRHKKTSLEKYSPLTLLQGFERLACERMLETERKLHILTPLLWPSRCVFLVLLDAQPEVLVSTPSGLFRGPPRSGVAFPTTSRLYCLEFDWQLLWHPKLNWVK